jgi:NAD(P)-dependent dehydrogenase (short-subunit alcohol dehydrogenase family)
MRKYLIVGASSGIGKSLAIKLKEDGNLVYGTYNTHKPDDELTGIEFIPYDVKSCSAIDFDFDVLDGFAYCVGAINLKPFARTSKNDFLEDYQLQVLGAVDVFKQFQQALSKSNQASVVFFSTVAVGNGFPYHSVVSSSKGAIEGLTRALSAEFCPKIRVNCIAPSLTKTPLASKLLSSEEKIEQNAQKHPLKFLAEPEDIASCASFLLSEDSRWITGQVLNIDGGISRIKI